MAQLQMHIGVFVGIVMLSHLEEQTEWQGNAPNAVRAAPQSILKLFVFRVVLMNY